MKKINRKPRAARRRYRTRAEMLQDIEKLSAPPLVDARHARIGLLFAVLGAGALLPYALIETAEHIERDLQTRVEEMLHARQFDDIHVQMNGRTAILTGHVASAARKKAAAETLAGMRGLRRVVNDVLVDDIAPQRTPTRIAAETAPVTPQTHHDNTVFPARLAETIQQAAARMAAQPVAAGQPVAAPRSATKPHSIPNASSITETQDDSPRTTTPSARNQAETSAPASPSKKASAPLRDAKPENLTPTEKSNSPPKRAAASRDSTLRPSVQRCQRRLTEQLKKEQIHFRFNSAHIRRESHPLLNRLFDIIQQACPPEAMMIIVGHTDNRGKASYNKQLSERRARAVRDWFVQKGMAAERLQALGRGEEAPIASNRTREGRTQNRRIEIKVFTKPH